MNVAQANGGGEGSSSGSLKRDLAKLIPRPSSFSPLDREQEVVQWRDWYWGFKQYLLVVDGAYQEEVEKIEENLTAEVDWDLLSEAEQQRGRFLYSLLGGLVQGRLMGLIRNVDHFNGYEALRQLLSNCQPNARNRTMSLLQGIMAYPSFNMRTSLLPQILKLEEHYVQYEKFGGKLSQDMKAAILLRSVGGQMKVHLNLALNEGSTYSQIREAIIAFDNATTKWNESAALSFTSPMPSGTDQGPTPMEVDRLQQKGKDKGKSKGKDPKGKDKGKGKSENGGKNGKGKGGKEKGGKGRGTSEVCWTCGKPGHISKDCWRVRQVEAPTTQILSATSQQGSTPSTTTTSTTSGGDVSSSKAIRRVSQPAVFDLRKTSLTGSIRMIQESPKSSVEYYSIATDDEAEEEDGPPYVINTIHQYDDMEVESQGLEEEEEMINVILDSGADASLFPGSLMDKGIPTTGACPYLQDAQGTKIKTYGHSDVDIVMHAKDGREVIIKERVTFSDVVSQPILSYGRLLRTGWSIDGGTLCLKHDEIEVPLVFQNQSLVVRAQVRVIHEPGMIRTLRVKLSQELQEAALGQYGWKKKGHFWLGLHSSRHYQTPQFVPEFRNQSEGFCRSTLVERRGQWELVEMAEPLDGLWEQEEPIEELKKEELGRVITFIAQGGTEPETFGFEVMDGFHFRADPGSLEELAVPEALNEEVEGMDIHGEEGQEGVGLEDQEAWLEVGVAVPSQLQVNGVVLTLDSPLRSLRAACAFYRIGQSGGKQKCFNRLMSHQHQLELLMARDLAAQGRAMDKRIPLEQVSAREPTMEEKKQHELTHLPYEAWCTACLKHRARQDQHRRTGKAHEQGCPTISFDFCYVKASGSGAVGGEEEDGAQAGLEVERGALLMVAVCSQTGYLLALPVKSKNQMSLITHELLAFTQILGHEEVQYYSDNEPTLRQILKLLVTARSAIGLKTTMRTTKIYDSAGNGLVENAIQRIRSLAATLMENLTEQIELRFQSQHPIWSWACRHSAWLINRFQPFHGSTSFELAHGRI